MATYTHRFTPATGNDPDISLFHVVERPMYCSSRLGVDAQEVDLASTTPTAPTTAHPGQWRYELTDHLGNVQAVVTEELLGLDGNNDQSVDQWAPVLLSAQDYETFGSLLPGRNYSSESYRFGYQGSEKTDEVSGSGNHYSTFFRELDVRVGNWWALDPKADLSPWESPYSSMARNPIWYNDPLGDYIPTTITNNAQQRECIDANGVPIKVSQEFENELGIRVTMINGNLTYAGDVEGWKDRVKSGDISRSERKMWMKALDPDKRSHQSLLFDSYTTEERGYQSRKNPFETDRFSGQSRFNLNAVHQNGTLKTIDYSAYPAGQNGRFLRSFSFQRVMSHEYLHGKHPRWEHASRDPLLRVMNTFRVQLGLGEIQRIVHRVGGDRHGYDPNAETEVGTPGQPDSYQHFRYNLPVE